MEGLSDEDNNDDNTMISNKKMSPSGQTMVCDRQDLTWAMRLLSLGF